MRRRLRGVTYRMWAPADNMAPRIRRRRFVRMQSGAPARRILTSEAISHFGLDLAATGHERRGRPAGFWSASARFDKLFKDKPLAADFDTCWRERGTGIRV